MTPAKAALLAELMAERFPCPDVLEAESRLTVPCREVSTAARNAALLDAAKRARVEHALSDTPKAVRDRQRVLRDLPVFEGDELWVPETLKGVA